MNKSLFLLRAFFPSWKFFDDVGPELKLEVRLGPGDQELGPWVNCLPPIGRSIKNLFFNPEGNYLHSCHTHLVHLHSEMMDTDAKSPETLLNKATFKITKNMVRFQISELGLGNAPFTFQFRIVVNFPEHMPSQDPEVILISPLYEG